MRCPGGTSLVVMRVSSPALAGECLYLCCREFSMLMWNRAPLEFRQILMVLLELQQGVQPPLELQQGTRGSSRVAAGDSDLPSSHSVNSVFLRCTARLRGLKSSPCHSQRGAQAHITTREEHPLQAIMGNSVFLSSWGHTKGSLDLRWCLLSSCLVPTRLLQGVQGVS